MELVNTIEKLLEKYFEATTTVAEEKELQAYFSGDDVAPHLEEYIPMFQSFSIARQERSTRPVPLKPQVNIIIYRWISVAAVAVLAFGIYFGNWYSDKQEIEMAYQETQKAFELIAQNLDRGTKKMGYLNEFTNTKSKILIND
ncbi:hypothetical protein [Ascidiimonas aurantiaca]|uniref:hypothetical protein n=1 Tax=Ascidiimonas aurantiaca TaxID=1685432 RepID=UPI0030EE2EFF